MEDEVRLCLITYRMRFCGIFLGLLKNMVFVESFYSDLAPGGHSRREVISIWRSAVEILMVFIGISRSTRTLLMIDVINLDAGISDGLKRELERDGVTLYEKVG